jgi:hypothetical protein
MILESKILDMAIFETFSKRKRRIENAGKQDVYQYTDLPQPFRIQIFHRVLARKPSCLKQILGSHPQHCRKGSRFAISQQARPGNERTMLGLYVERANRRP